MFRSKVCMTLSASTLEENCALVEKYRSWIDIAELRVDFLAPDERLYIRRFPELVKMPVILTIRRKIDGGRFVEGEASRTTLFARALAFADQDVRKNYAYIDLEEDFKVSSLQDAAFAFGTRVIRSIHSMNGPLENIAAYVPKLRVTGYEIPKIAFMPRNLADVTDSFVQARGVKDVECILVAMGSLGAPSRILAGKLHSFLTFTSPAETMGNLSAIGHLDPVALADIYNFSAIDANTKIYALAGNVAAHMDVIRLHNAGFRSRGMNAVFIPLITDRFEQVLDFAEKNGVNALSVTCPFKSEAVEYCTELSSEAGEVRAVNLIVRNGANWIGYNTDSLCMTHALRSFLGLKNLRGFRVAIIGAGATARAAAYMVKNLRGRACIFNRTVSHAEELAEHYGFEWASLGEESTWQLRSFSDIIIQATSVGLPAADGSQADPLDFYDFTGEETVFDTVYCAKKTPLLRRASAAGCRTVGCSAMIHTDAAQQFALYTGVPY